MKKTKLTTTFNLLREHGACASGYRRLAHHLGSVDAYGADKPINLLIILETNGLDDFLWCLRATKEDSGKVSRHLAADFAEAALHTYEDKYPGDNRPRLAISAARGMAESDPHGSAWSAARSAAESAARSAAESAAESAAWIAAWSAQIEQVKKRLVSDRNSTVRTTTDDH